MRRLSVLMLAISLSSLSSTTSLAAAQSTAASPTTLRVRGTIEKYEVATRILSVSTTNGTLRFTLALTARIRQGWHAIDASLLETLTGYRVDVRYSESGGKKTVESVHVNGKSKG